MPKHIVTFQPSATGAHQTYIDRLEQRVTSVVDEQQRALAIVQSALEPNEAGDELVAAVTKLAEKYKALRDCAGRKTFLEGCL